MVASRAASGPPAKNASSGIACLANDFNVSVLKCRRIARAGTISYWSMERTVPIKNRVTGTSGTGTGGTRVYEPSRRNRKQPIIMSMVSSVISIINIISTVIGISKSIFFSSN